MTAAADHLNRTQAILAGIPYTVTKQFPWKLHEMLEQVEKDEDDSIVSWLPSGRSFKVGVSSLKMTLLKLYTISFSLIG